MGGHGHGPTIKIPSHEIYKVEDVPELMEIQQKLAAKGLKDPWLRNEVWRHTPDWGTRGSRLRDLIFRGWKLAVPAFLLTIAAEHALGIDWHDYHHAHSHDESGHGDNH